MASELLIRQATEVTKTIFRRGEMYWIDLVVMCEDGSSTEISIYAKNEEAFNKIQQQLNIAEVKQG